MLLRRINTMDYLKPAVPFRFGVITVDRELSINERSNCLLKVHEGTTSAPSIYKEGQL